MICADSCPLGNYKRKYKFTNRLNSINETNLVWRNSHNTTNKVIVIYYVMSKMVIIFEK